MNISAGAMEHERLAWNGKTYPVLNWPAPEYVRDHLREFHGMVDVPYDRPDTRSDEEVMARHERMHAVSRDGVVDAHFHVERPDLPPLPDTFEDRAADMIVKDWEAISERWGQVLDEARNGSARTEDQAVRFVLVEVFGDMRLYFHDPEFHAKVSLASQMLQQLRSAVYYDRFEHR
jgi:hypothetical protein